MEQCDIVTSSDSSGPVWARFSQDPRDPVAGRMRASDADRGVVSDLLADAFADGRLDHEEFAQRSEAATGAKLLGELPALIDDLVPVASAKRDLAAVSSAEIEELARRHWRESLRNAFLGMLIPSLITTAIWIATGLGYPWPLWVVLGTGINLVRVAVARHDIVEEERRRLERKQRKAIEKRERKAIEHPDVEDEPGRGED